MFFFACAKVVVIASVQHSRYSSDFISQPNLHQYSKFPGVKYNQLNFDSQSSYAKTQTDVQNVLNPREPSARSCFFLRKDAKDRYCTNFTRCVTDPDRLFPFIFSHLHGCCVALVRHFLQANLATTLGSDICTLK